MNPKPIVTLEEAITTLREWLSHHSSNTLKPYEFLFRKLVEEQDSNPTLNALEVVSSFYERHLQVPAYLRPETRTGILKAGILLRVVSLLRGQQIPLKSRFYKGLSTEWSSEIENEYSGWMFSTHKKLNTIKSRTGRVKALFTFMESCKIYRIQDLALDDFIAFVGSLDKAGYTSQGKHNILYTVRDFLKCPYVKERLSCNPMPIFCNMHTKKHEGLPSFYDAGEVLRVLNVIDRSKPKGKLSYAVILLAGIYGLRSIDIRELRLTSLKWDTNQIFLMQKKTGGYIELPLIPEVKWALLDYIKNVRPKVNNPYVFIRTRMPQIPYSKNDHFTHLVSPYFEIAGIDISKKHHGLHSLRHSLATKGSVS